MKSLIPAALVAVTLLTGAFVPGIRNAKLDDPFRRALSAPTMADTIPLRDRTGDFLRNRPTNPFDLRDPKAINQDVEFDPVTGRYIITERIGDEHFRPATYMTFEEYLEYRRKQDERSYFDFLSGATTDGKINSLDPIAKIDVSNSLIDRLFGGTEVDIKPEGNIDLTFGFDIQRLENPILLERQRTTGGFNFDMAIRMNVTGQIGTKLTLSTNYNTNATFNFDNQIKINYNTDALNDPFSEDAIIKKIEAGNVSLPLRGTLIQGAQSLFGIKTELQFGRLRLTSVVSQQNSQKQNLKIEGGSQLQEFEVRADEYDENRHFFLSFFNRETFEENLSNLPQVRSLFKLENMEVWVTNNRNEVDDVREIVAFADLGEPSQATLVSPNIVNAPVTPVYRDITGTRGLPDNAANDLYARLTADNAIRKIDNAVASLQGPAFNMLQAQDFEKVFARKLKPTEYTINHELGFVSLGVNIQPDQVVAVTYSYSYNGKLYFVGDRPENIPTTTLDSVPQVLFAKMLKSTTQRTDLPTWDLMMKNVYPIGAYQVDPKEFRLDVYYEDPGRGIKRFLPFTNLEGRPLLRVFQLDKLNTQGDPQPDGIFDFVPGVTINTRNGRIMFPVLEPFGRSLAAQIDDPILRDSVVYQELYDSTLFLAREFAEKNRFIIKGDYKSSVSSEISLGAFNIPPGSVNVTAGGQLLVEGQDYEIDYNIGRVRILNDALLQSGVPVNVSYEDNTLFGFQTKTMMGIRADYEVSKKLNFGATFMQLFERPFTPKVNIGEDPINNRIYGFDVNYTTDAPFLTKLADKIPGIQTKAPSTFNFMAETALLKPGHARAINQSRRDDGGIVYIDDFEGTSAGLDLRQPVNQWYLSSVPQNNSQWPEGQLINDLAGGANRAKLNWYRIDLSARAGSDNDNPYTSLVDQNEVFPNVQVTPDQLPNIQTFDLTFYPNERGPYNFDLPAPGRQFSSGITFNGDSLVLNDPVTRWGGIMRSLNTVDFQTANIEYLEFWMLSPFLDPDNPNGSLPVDQLNALEGNIYFHFGNLSEDILRDSRKFFENGLPTPFNPDRRVDTTAWGVVPVTQQITRSFDNDRRGGAESRARQDVGLDGLDDEGERAHFREYIEAIRAANPAVAAKIELDPSNDNFRYFRDDSFGPNDGLLRRYRDFNNPQGNSPENTGQAFIFSSTNIPDAEDLNLDNTLNETEAYFQYRVPVFYDRNNPREIDMEATPFITDRRLATNGRVWYRFRVPLNNLSNTDYITAIGGIRDFRSIRFMRMMLKDFGQPVTMRFATLELVRNQWRRYQQELLQPPVECTLPVTFNIDAVNIEENISRLPFNYVLPAGIIRERSLGVFNALQNEQSLSLVVDNLCDGKDVAVFKTTNLDLRVYKTLRMFVHAESKRDGQLIRDGATSVFIRIGSDFRNNYYEYEIPLVMSDPARLPSNQNSDEYKNEVWRPENEFDFDLEILRLLKDTRNEINFPVDLEYVQSVPGRAPGLMHQIKVRGNPNLGLAKQIMVGVRNIADNTMDIYDLEVWINELRLNGLDERAAGAAVARADIQMADLASFTLAGNYSSIGFGGLNDKVAQRSREALYGYDFAANVQLGKFLPEKWGINLPFYGQLSNATRRPEYDPYDLDVPLKVKLAAEEDKAVRDSIRDLALDVTQLRSINFTNVRKERAPSAQQPKPWDISNFSANYSYTQTARRDPLIESDAEDRRTGGLDYAYSRPVKYIEPLKKAIKNDKYFKWLTGLNFNPIPNSFTFRTVLNRQFNETRYRFTGLPDRFSTFYNKRYNWDRDYNLQWDMARSLKFTFTATTNAVVDEPDEVWMQEQPDITDINRFRRDSIWNSLKNFGRIKNYRHAINLNYTLPTRTIPFMDWIQVRAQYQAEYNWTAIALNVDSLGNVAQNKQRRQLNADFNFDNLYAKLNYFKKIERGRPPQPQKGKTEPPTDPRQKQATPQTTDKDKKDNKDRQVSALELALVRPLLMIRKVRFTLSEDFSTSLPGFLPQAGILGMGSGFEGPGWDFIAGLQPRIRTLQENEYYTSKDWLHEVGNNRRWVSNSVYQNREVLQDYTQRIDGRLTIEPYRDFRIDVELNRSFSEGHSEFFKDTLADGVFSLIHAVPKKSGSMMVSYLALGTPMSTDTTIIRRLFKQFDENRVLISQRLGQGSHVDTTLAQRGFTDGYGHIQNEVLLPAFIAAYSGKDARTMGLDVFKILPSPNWRLSYNGLSKIPLFSKIFQNFSLTHGYKSTLTVNRFDTNPLWLDNRNQTVGDPFSGNFYARLLIPEVVIQEAFSPLIAVDATLKNGMSFNVDFKKSRMLAMSFISYQLAETQSKEVALGFGYLLRGVDIAFLTGSNKKGAKKPDPKAAPTQQRPGAGGRGGRGGGQLASQDLDINFNMSLRDDVTFNHLLDQGVIEPVRGNYALTFSPSAEYQINTRLGLRLFFDYRQNIPRTSAGFPRVDTSGGLVVRFKLN